MRLSGIWGVKDPDLKYQGQLAAYIKAFKATTGFDADAKTYHIDI